MRERSCFEQEIHRLLAFRERHPYESDLSNLRLLEQPDSTLTPSATGTKWPRVMFEFDVDFGFHDSVDAETTPSTGTARRGRDWPRGYLTTHTKDAAYFDVKRDWNRLEIGTDDFALSAKGWKKIETVKRNIAAFVAKLEQSCRDHGTTRTDVRLPGIDGHPRLFPMPDANTSATGALIHKRWEWRDKRKVFPSSCRAWASPQAHVAIPLAKVGELVDEIKYSIGKPDGLALTGGGRRRMGVRSDHLFKAKVGVEGLRKKIIATGRTLTDGTAVNAATFSPNLGGFLILQVSYLWVRNLAGRQDKEQYGKGHLPINVKTPFPEIYAQILTDTERKIYEELLAGKSVRTTMFGLVKDSPSLSDGSTKLFPDVTGDTFSWDDLLDWTLGTLSRSAEFLPGGGKVWHASKTKPRVALELRRIGFKRLYATKWNTLIDRIVALAQRLN